MLGTYTMIHVVYTKKAEARKFHEWGTVGFLRREKMTHLSTVCKSSMLKSKSESGTKDGQPCAIPMKAFCEQNAFD